MATLELEKQLALLVSILDRGGRGTKEAVLNHVESEGYLDLDDRDCEIMLSRDEAVWRNNIAFSRHHLVLKGAMARYPRNNWAITEQGRQYFRELVDVVAHTPNLQKVTETCRIRALRHAAAIDAGGPGAA